VTVAANVVHAIFGASASVVTVVGAAVALLVTLDVAVATSGILAGLSAAVGVAVVAVVALFVVLSLAIAAARRSTLGVALLATFRAVVAALIRADVTITTYVRLAFRGAVVTGVAVVGAVVTALSVLDDFVTAARLFASVGAAVVVDGVAVVAVLALIDDRVSTDGFVSVCPTVADVGSRTGRIIAAGEHQSRQ
jgi:hypothetical protein